MNTTIVGRKYRWIRRLFPVLTGVLLVSVGVTPGQAQIVMKLSTATINDTQHEWLKRFAATVTEATAGRIKGEVYPASQLGSIPRQIESTQLGAIQGWVGPPEFLSGLDKRFEVLSAPGVFRSMEHTRRILADPAFESTILKLADDKNLKGVALFAAGPMAIGTRKSVQRLSDLQGLKIRVLASQIQLEQVKKIGATPLPMALGEVLPAIQQGTIDGLMTNIQVMTAFRFYDAAPNVLETNHAYVTSIAMLSKRWFDGLAPDLQKIVLDSAARTTQGLYPFIAQSFEDQRAAWKQRGGKLIDVSESERSNLMSELSKVSDEVFSKDPGLKEAYRALVAAAEKNK